MSLRDATWDPAAFEDLARVLKELTAKHNLKFRFAPDGFAAHARQEDETMVRRVTLPPTTVDMTLSFRGHSVPAETLFIEVRKKRQSRRVFELALLTPMATWERHLEDPNRNDD